MKPQRRIWTWWGEMCALQPGRKHLLIQHTQGVNMQIVVLGRSPAPFISNKSVHSFLQSTTAFTAKHISPTSDDFSMSVHMHMQTCNVHAVSLPERCARSNGISLATTNKAAGSWATLLARINTLWRQRSWCLSLMYVSPDFWWSSQLCAPHGKLTGRRWSWQCYYWCLQSSSGQWLEMRSNTAPGLLQGNHYENHGKRGGYGFHDGKNTRMPIVMLLASKITWSTCSFNPVH